MADTQGQQHIEDNMYPSQTDQFNGLEQPEEEKKREQAEKAKVTAALPLIDELLSHLEQRIAFHDSVTSIKVDARDPEAFMRHYEAGQLTRSHLVQEHDWLMNLRQQHSPQ